MDQWIVGIDLGGTKMALGLIDPDGQIATRRRLQTDADAGPADVVERIAQSVADLARELPHGARIAVLGICCPGPVDHEAGTPIDPPNIKGLHHAPLRQMLSERLGLPACLEHDAKAAALGEFHHGAGRGEQNMVYIVVDRRRRGDHDRRAPVSWGVRRRRGGGSHYPGPARRAVLLWVEGLRRDLCVRPLAGPPLPTRDRGEWTGARARGRAGV